MAVKQEASEPKLLTRAVRVELLKPINCTWDELGTVLRTQRQVMGSLIQAAVDAIVACDVVGSGAVKLAVAPKAKAKSPAGLGYQAMLKELERIKGGKWSAQQLAALDIAAGAVLAPLSKRAASDYSNWRSAQYSKRQRGQGKRGRASYGRMQPIPVHNANWSLRRDGKGLSIELKLLSKGKLRVLVAPSRGSHWETLRGIVSGSLPHGDCKLLYDERRRKWYGLLSYAEPAIHRPECSPDRVLVIHRGMHNFLTALSSTGHFNKMTPGRKLLAAKRRFKARRDDVKNVSKSERGSGGKGHGTPRRYALPDALAEKEKRFIRTYCRQQAARVVQLAVQWGCGTVVLEDYGGIQPSDDPNKRRFVERFPFHELGECIAWALRKSGLTLETVASEYISSECPACGNLDSAQHNRRTGVFHCAQCSFDRDADWVAPLQMLRRFLGHGGEHDKRVAQERRMALRLRKNDDAKQCDE